METPVKNKQYKGTKLQGAKEQRKKKREGKKEEEEEEGGEESSEVFIVDRSRGISGLFLEIINIKISLALSALILKKRALLCLNKSLVKHFEQ